MTETGRPGVDPLVVSTAEQIFGDLEASTPAGHDADTARCWDALRDSGLPWLGVAEDAGGEGGTLADAAAVLAVSARHPLPVPFAENWIAASLLAAAGLPVPRGADSGPLTVALPRAPYADHVAAVVTVTGRTVARLDEFTTTPGANLAGEPRDAVAGRPATTGELPEGTPDLDQLGALVRSVQLASALEAVLDMTTRYAGQRTQFGRPIAKFQAVAHLVAQLAEQTAAARLAADLAVAGAERGDWSQAAIGKSVCGAAAGAGARLAHQVHGAIGVTEEYRLAAFTRRLFAWRDDFGAERTWDLAIGATVVGLDPDALWRIVVAEDPAVVS